MAKAAIRWCICICILLSCADLFAQDNASMQLFVKGNISLDSLTNLVHTKTGVRFSFNSVKVKGSKVIYFPAGKYTVSKLLQHVHATTGLFYFSYKKYYIFQDNPPKSKAGTTAVASTTTPLRKSTASKHTPAKNNVKKVVQKDSAIVNKKPVTTVKKETNRKDTTPTIQVDTIVKVVDTTHTAKPIIIPEKRNIDTAKKTSPPKDTVANTIPTSTKRSIWHLQAGVFSTEVLFANAGVELGIRPIHALFSYASNFEVSGPRLGLGSIIRNKEKTQLQVKATVCFLQRDYIVDSFSTPLDTKIKGELYTASAEWCRKINKHFVFKAGISFNMLHSTYYRMGQKAVLGYWPYFEEGGDKYIHLLHPPFMTSNTYDDFKNDNWKSWVGLSVGLYYTFKRNR